MTDETNNEQPRKGRSNAILTYEEVAAIHLSIQKVGLGIERLDEKLDEVTKQHIDHEVRIRALELTAAGHSASSGSAKWLWQAMWPAAAFGISLLSYLSK